MCSLIYLMVGHIVTQIHFIHYSVSEMAYEVNITALIPKVCWSISGIIIKICPLALPGMIFIMIWYVFVWGD